MAGGVHLDPHTGSTRRSHAPGRDRRAAAGCHRVVPTAEKKSSGWRAYHGVPETLQSAVDPAWAECSGAFGGGKPCPLDVCTNALQPSLASAERMAFRTGTKSGSIGAS